jgi:hypothetical protein
VLSPTPAESASSAIAMVKENARTGRALATAAAQPSARPLAPALGS